MSSATSGRALPGPASLDSDVIDSTLAEARDNAGFGSVDPDLALAEPDGVEMADLDLYDESILEFATDDKIQLALDVEKMAQAGDPRVRAGREHRLRPTRSARRPS